MNAPDFDRVMSEALKPDHTGGPQPTVDLAAIAWREGRRRHTRRILGGGIGATGLVAAAAATAIALGGGVTPDASVMPPAVSPTVDDGIVVDDAPTGDVTATDDAPTGEATGETTGEAPVTDETPTASRPSARGHRSLLRRPVRTGRRRRTLLPLVSARTPCRSAAVTGSTSRGRASGWR